MAEHAPLTPLGEPTRHAHECLQRALLASGGRYALPNPYPDGWRDGPLGIEQVQGEPPESRFWLIAPWEPGADPHAVQGLAVFKQILTSLTPAHRAGTSVVLTCAELPPEPLLDALERTLGVGVVACTSREAASGPRARQEGAAARVEALLRIEDGLLSAVDPAAAWAQVTQTQQGLAEAYQFHQRLRALTPRVVVTPVVITACVAVWLLQLLNGISPTSPNALELQAWGSNAAMLTLEGQPWRLLTAAFLHGGIVHLGINMWVLRDVGPLCERLFGRWAYAAVYLFACVGSGLTSLAWRPESVGSVGASGGIFGLAGAIGGFMLARRHVVPPSVLLRFKRSLGAFVAINLIFGLAINLAPVGILVDNAAHMGGLIAGFVAGFLLSRPLEPEARVPQRLLFAPLLALGLIGGFVAIQHSPAIAEQAARARRRIDAATLLQSLQPLLTRVDQEWADLFNGLSGADPEAARQRFLEQTAATRSELQALALDARHQPLRAALDDLLAARLGVCQALEAQTDFEAAEAAEEQAQRRFEAVLEELFR